MKNIKTLTIILLVIFVKIYPVICQDSLVYYLEQRESTEKQLQQYVKDIFNKNTQYKEIPEYVYINFIPPMACPRCEGIINVYNSYLEKQTEGKAFIIDVMIYKKPNSLSTYVKNQGFKGNIICVDTTKQIAEELFYVNNDMVCVPYITKVNTKEGKLIYSLPTLGSDVNEELVAKVIEKETVKQGNRKHEPVANDVQLIPYKLRGHNLEESLKSFIPVFLDSFIIAGSDTLPQVSMFCVNKKCDRLIINNHLTNSFIMYSKTGNEFVNPVTICPSEDDNKRYIDESISEEIYEYCKNSKILVSMFLKADFASNNEYYVIASLPDLHIDTIRNSIGYWNKSVCMVNGKTNAYYDFSKFEEDIYKEHDYAIIHSSATLFKNDGLFVFLLSKGLGHRGQFSVITEENENDNIFADKFYDNTNTLLIYDYEKEKYYFTAPLDNLYKKYKIGYGFNHPLIKNINNEYYYTDAVIGKIYRLNKDFMSDVTPLFDLFSIDTLIFQKPLKEDATYIDSYSTFFYKQIIDFDIFNDKTCAAIVKNSTTNDYVLIAYKDEKISICPVFANMLTVGDDKMRLTSMQFGYNDKGEKVIYGLCQNNEKIILQTFELPRWLLE